MFSVKKQWQQPRLLTSASQSMAAILLAACASGLAQDTNKTSPAGAATHSQPAIHWHPDFSAEQIKELERNVAAFPAKEGYVKIVIPPLPHRDSKTEILAGKVLDVDCNVRGGGSQITKQTLEGWGFDYLVYEGRGVGNASTLMACVPDVTSKRFVASDRLTLNNNPRLPIVIYSKADTTIQYRHFISCPLQTAYGSDPEPSKNAAPAPQACQ